jgi:hypothetical protein
MKFNSATTLLVTMMAAVSDVSATSSFGYDIAAFPEVPDTTLTWSSVPDIPHVPPCEHIDVSPHSTFFHTIEVDHCLLDCRGNAIRGQGLDPAVRVRNNGILYNCPIDVDRYATGVLCDQGDCFLLSISCQGNKDFNECVLVKNHAENVVIAGMSAVDSNGKHGVNALEAYNANLYIIESEIKNQRNDGIKALRIQNLYVSYVNSSSNKGDGVDMYDMNFAMVLESQFYNNVDEGIDATRILDFLVALSEAKDNLNNGLEIIASSQDYVNIIDSYFDSNGFGTKKTKERNGVYIEGPHEVDILRTRAEYNNGDGVFLQNAQRLAVDSSYAAYNGADGFDLRHMTDANFYSVESYENNLAGLRAVGNGEIYIEQQSKFYQNGKDSRHEYHDRAGVTIKNMRKVYIDETDSYDNSGDGFVVLNVADVDIQHSKSERNENDGFNIATSANVEIKYETAAANNGDAGIRLKDIDYLKFDEHVKAYENRGRGFDLRDIGHADVYKTDSYKNGNDGFYAFEVQYFNVQESDAVENGKDGFFIDNGNVHTEVNFNDVVACNNLDDGMDFQEGFDEGTLLFDPSDGVFACFNHELDLQFDGVIDVNIGGTFDLVAPASSRIQGSSNHRAIYADISADTCGDKHGNVDIQECKDLEIAACGDFVCPTY